MGIVILNYEKEILPLTWEAKKVRAATQKLEKQPEKVTIFTSSALDSYSWP